VSDLEMCTKLIDKLRQFIVKDDQRLDQLFSNVSPH
jgi:hypothetical protein